MPQVARSSATQQTCRRSVTPLFSSLRFLPAGNCETRCMGDAECRAGKCVQPAAAKAAADEEPATVRGQVKADERTPETAAAVEVASATKAAAVEPAPAAKAADGDAVGVDDKEEERKCPTDGERCCSSSTCLICLPASGPPTCQCPPARLPACLPASGPPTCQCPPARLPACLPACLPVWPGACCCLHQTAPTCDPAACSRSSRLVRWQLRRHGNLQVPLRRVRRRQLAGALWQVPALQERHGRHSQAPVASGHIDGGSASS